MLLLRQKKRRKDREEENKILIRNFIRTQDNFHQIIILLFPLILNNIQLSMLDVIELVFFYSSSEIVLFFFRTRQVMRENKNEIKRENDHKDV